MSFTLLQDFALLCEAKSCSRMRRVLPPSEACAERKFRYGFDKMKIRAGAALPPGGVVSENQPNMTAFSTLSRYSWRPLMLVLTSPIASAYFSRSWMVALPETMSAPMPVLKLA